MISGIACFWDRPRIAGSSLETHCRVASTPLVHWGPSQNHSFSQWFSTFSKRPQCCVQLMIKSVADCFPKSREGSEDCGRGPYCENVHFRKVFKGFRPIDEAAMLLMKRPLWGGHAGNACFSIVFGCPRGASCSHTWNACFH